MRLPTPRARVVARERIASQKCPLCASMRTEILGERTFQGRPWALARCRDCGLHFTDPPPSQEEIAAFYQADFHAQLRAEGATEECFLAKYERYAAMLGRHLRRGQVVDVGCATGLLVRILKDRGYAAEGVELNPLSASWGREHYDVTIHDQPLDRCPYEPESLDALLLTDVLEHTPHPPDFLREAGRLLVPGGFVLVTFPDIRSLERRYFRAIAEALPRLRSIWWWSCYIPLHIWEFTRPSAEKCFEAAGFRVVEFRRTQSPAEFPVAGRLLRLLLLPMRLLRWPPFQRWFGGQMEFVIQKTSTGSPRSPEVGCMGLSPAAGPGDDTLDPPEAVRAGHRPEEEGLLRG